MQSVLLWLDEIMFNCGYKTGRKWCSVPSSFLMNQARGNSKLFYPKVGHNKWGRSSSVVLSTYYTEEFSEDHAMAYNLPPHQGVHDAIHCGFLKALNIDHSLWATEINERGEKKFRWNAGNHPECQCGILRVTGPVSPLEPTWINNIFFSKFQIQGLQQGWAISILRSWTTKAAQVTMGSWK